MNSLERMNAAIHGKPFDTYPYTNPYPFWSMMPHWPAMTGKSFLSVDYGSDIERLQYYRVLLNTLGIDWLPVDFDRGNRDRRFSIDQESDIPVLIDTESGTRTRFDEYPKDEPKTERKYHTVRDVECQPDPPSVEEILEYETGMTRKIVREFGDETFTFATFSSPFAECFRTLTFTGLYEAIVDDPSLLHTILERETNRLIHYGTAAAQIGVHGARINEYPCGAELLSSEHYLEFVFPYEKRLFQALREAGLVTILEYLGWVEPRLPHIMKLDIDCLQTESSLKGYRNRVEHYRQVLGDGICIFSNSPIYEVIERGDKDCWRRDAIEQGKGIGLQRRFVICAGSPTTWATKPERIRHYGDFMRSALAEISPPHE